MAIKSGKTWIVLMAAGASMMLIAQGCAKKDASTKLSIPQVQPKVKASLPAGLKPGAVSPVAPALLQSRAEIVGLTTDYSSLASAYIINLFQDDFASSAGNVKGFINSQVTTVDDRMSLFQGVAVTGCLSNTPAPYTIDMSAIDPILNFTLNNIQCYAPFGSNANTDAGEAFGQKGSDTSLWVQASDSVASTGTAGVTYANVKNLGSTSASAPETVDGVSMIFTPNTSAGHGGQLTIARYTAIPSKNTFELYMGSNGGVIKGMPGSLDSFLGAGFRLISNGTYIYAEGTLCTTASATTCNQAGNWAPFTVCLDATTIQATTDTNCTTLRTSFALGTSASLTYGAITGDGTSYDHMASSIGPSDSNASLALAASKISQFSSVATKY